MDELISRFDLEADRKLRKMSKGMKQKVALVSAFMHDPQILILDEPTSGLDPLMQQRFIEMIIEEKKRGKTILMSSHLFEEVERTSDRVAIIKDGRIVAIETVATLKAGARKTYRVSVGSEKDRDKIIASGLSVTEVAPLLFEIMIKNDFKEMFEVLRTVDVVNLESFEQTLEKVFIHYYEKGGN
jgi:ABC-2 type transport system ATP-binding protein